MDEAGTARARRRMVDDLVDRGITDRRVLTAMAQVPREAFVPQDLRRSAYDDRPLRIGHGQTISQPYVVALTIQSLSLQDTDRVLDVGTGSGYAAAIAARMAAEVVGIERLPELAARARANLASVGAAVEVVVGDGSAGWPSGAPWDAIAVGAAPPNVPPALVHQLADGGRLVLPVGGLHDVQRLVRLVRAGDEVTEEHLIDVRFVPLVVDEG